MKLTKLFIFSALLFTTVACGSKYEGIELSIIVPTGTPLLGMSTYLANNDKLKTDVVSGAEGLSAAFTSESKDIIVAPVNLGANMYSKTGKYVLFETFVWGNLYVASKNPISSFADLQDKKIAIFGTNQTPDIVMKTLAKVNNVTYEKMLTESVESSTALFKQGQVEYFVGAEPSLSKVKATTEGLYTLDLQEEWKKITGSSSYPQAGIFVKKSETDRLKNELKEMKKCINDITKDLDYTASCAMKQETLSKLGEETIKTALPNCHFGIDPKQKEAIEFYFNKLIELDLGKTFGGVIPNEDFYLSI